ncbi:MAG: DUF2160 domain-containing protein [Pseudomonadota bacterium]
MDWMAWTLPTALFFAGIASALAVMSLLAIKRPSTSRMGALGIETARGDRLFLTLLGSAFVNLAWIGLTDWPQYWALGLCAVFALGVFRWV